MTNDDVIKLVGAGLSNDVVINAVRDAGARNFDLSAAGLVGLKKAKVTDAIIIIMQEASKAIPSEVHVQPSATPAANYHDLYMREERKGDKPPFGDYIILSADGTYSLYDIHLRAADSGLRAADSGTYRVEGSVINFTPSASPSSKLLVSDAKDSVKIEVGKITEPDGHIWTTASYTEKQTAQMQMALARRTAESAQTQAPGCDGIDMMGLYKNEIFDRAMGGGVVEWLAKIRNNTSVTKIIKFSWVDQYGQKQVGQVQLRGGDIASPRVDMTQVRYITPVKDLKLVSCE